MAQSGRELPSWGIGSNAPADVRAAEDVLECEVSKVICAMPFLWLAVDDEPGAESVRGYIERNAIALLSNFEKKPLDPPSAGWLGHYCNRELVASRVCGTRTMSMRLMTVASLAVLTTLSRRWGAPRDRRHPMRGQQA
jgi:hypothetical protein